MGEVGQVSVFDVLDGLLHGAVGFEGVVPSQKEVYDYCERPHIQLLAAVVSTFNLLGRHVAGAAHAHGREDVVPAAEQAGVAEISNFELALGVQQQVLNAQIAVAHALLMHRDKGVHEVSSIPTATT